MAEHVVTFGGGPFDERERFDAAMDRFGGPAGQAREPSSDDVNALFAWLVAAKDRYPITRVVRHVCHHDEGIGTCVDSVVEG